MLKQPGREPTLTSYQYDSLPPEDLGKTYEQLLAEGYEEEFSFRAGDKDHIPMVQEKLRTASATGRYLVSVVKGRDFQTEHILYIVKKLKPEPKA